MKKNLEYRSFLIPVFIYAEYYLRSVCCAKLELKTHKKPGKKFAKRHFLFVYLHHELRRKIRKKIKQLKAGASGLGSIVERATGKRENKFGAFFMLVGEPI